MTRGVRRVACALLLAISVCALSLSADSRAQDKPRDQRSEKRKHKASASNKRKSETAPRPSKIAGAHAAVNATPASKSEAPHVEANRSSPPPMAADDADVHKEGGTEVKTMEFGGLDIEGQLKTPQMLYFLNRLRAEFDRPSLPHRSFIPEVAREARGAKEHDF
jgi:hypothetical protein